LFFLFALAEGATQAQNGCHQQFFISPKNKTIEQKKKKKNTQNLCSKTILISVCL